MVGFLLPFATGLFSAGALGAFGGLFEGIGAETHAPYEHYQPQTTYAPVTSIQYPDYQVQIESPGAVQTSKKTMKTEADIRPTQAYAPETTEGIPIVPIAIISAVVIIGASYLGKKNK